MNNKKWKIIEPPLPRHLKKSDICFHARDFISGEGYNYCETNDLISNFKKSGERKKNVDEWKHRNDAILRFKEEILHLFKEVNQKTVTAMAMPSSKKEDHPGYNNRFEDLFKTLKLNIDIIEECPVKIKNNIKASSQGGTREPKDIKNNYIWMDFKEKIPKVLWVFDDVITMGTHFRAISDFLRSNQYQGLIVGVIWARAKEKEGKGRKIVD